MGYGIYRVLLTARSPDPVEGPCPSSPIPHAAQAMPYASDRRSPATGPPRIAGIDPLQLASPKTLHPHKVDLGAEWPNYYPPAAFHQILIEHCLAFVTQQPVGCCATRANTRHHPELKRADLRSREMNAEDRAELSVTSIVVPRHQPAARRSTTPTWRTTDRDDVNRTWIQQESDRNCRHALRLRAPHMSLAVREEL
jgi:hypothetical protein